MTNFGSKIAAYLLLAGVAVSAAVTVTQQQDRISVRIDQGSETFFYYGQEVTKPYVYPLRLASGTVVSRMWPMEPPPGERHDHMHHRGLWFAHSNVNGIDFWNSDPSYHNDHMGHIVVTKINRLTSGERSGSIDADLDWLTPANEVLLQEHRTMTFYSGNPRIIDCDFILTARTSIRFGDDKDGVFGIRLAAALEEPAKDAPPEPARTGVMTSSAGCQQEAGCWGKRADWIDVSGRIGQEDLGVAILDHPENPRHPTYWHARGYGLVAANVFGVRAFTNDKENDGSLTLARGGKLRFRYRVVIHSGSAQAVDLERLYQRYTK